MNLRQYYNLVMGSFRVDGGRDIPIFQRAYREFFGPHLVAGRTRWQVGDSIYGEEVRSAQSLARLLNVTTAEVREDAIEHAASRLAMNERR